MKQIRTDDYRCDTCKHGHRGANQYPCDECQQCNWAYYHEEVIEEDQPSSKQEFRHILEQRIDGLFETTGKWEMQVPDDT